jgi:hypothetical protein
LGDLLNAYDKKKCAKEHRGQYGTEVTEEAFLASDLSLGEGKKEMLRGAIIFASQLALVCVQGFEGFE